MNPKTVFSYLAVVALSVLALGIDPAAAQGFLQDASTKIESVYTWARMTLYYVGGVGLIVLAVFAFFGKFKWTHFFALAGGLFLIGIADQLIRWLSNNAMTG